MNIKSLFLPILFIITAHITGMEQTLNFVETLRICPNQIVSHLDGKTLSALTRVSHLFQAICNEVPTKYLNLIFSDAVNHKNIQLINRFSAQPNSWMFTSIIYHDDMYKKTIGKDTIEAPMYLFNNELDDFFNTYTHVIHLIQNNKTVRYVLLRLDSSQKNRGMIYLNVNKCSDAANTVLTDRLGIFARHLSSIYNFFYFINEPAHGGYIGVDPVNESFIHKHFSLSSPLHSTEDIFKQFGLITIFLIAAQKNCTPIVYSILNNSEVLDSWSPDILNIAQYNLDNSNEIKDLVAAVLSERETKNKEKD